MEKPKGYDDVSVYGKNGMKKFIVYINDVLYGETTAVSAEKAANNIRWQIYTESSGWWDVPPMEAFDCVEI